TLQPIYLLDLVEQVLLYRPRSLDAQDIVRVHRTLAQPVTRAHRVALVHTQVLADRDLVDPLVTRLGDDDHLALATLDVPEPDATIDLGDHRRLLRLARLEQLGDTRQTTGDVPRLVRLAGDLRQRGARGHPLPVPHRELCTHRDDELTQLLTGVRIEHLDSRVQLLVPIVGDDHLPPPGRLVQLLPHRLLIGDVDEAQDALEVSHDRLGVRVPAEQHVADGHLLLVLHR